MIKKKKKLSREILNQIIYDYVQDYKMNTSLLIYKNIHTHTLETIKLIETRQVR